MTDLTDLYAAKVNCSACRLRNNCTQVVPGIGSMDHPILLIIGESPGEKEDEKGEPFVGASGHLLRRTLRATKILNRSNTLITNVLGCRPPKNKFPTDDSALICSSNWLLKEIQIATPRRMLLLGNVPLKHVAGMTGITARRGNWYDVRGIRTMATYHPSYVLRRENGGDLQAVTDFEADVHEVAGEVERLLAGGGR